MHFLSRKGGDKKQTASLVHIQFKTMDGELHPIENTNLLFRVAGKKETLTLESALCLI